MVEFEHRQITCIMFMKITKYHRHMLFLTLRHKYFYQSVAHTHVLSISRSISKILKSLPPLDINTQVRHLLYLKFENYIGLSIHN